MQLDIVGVSEVENRKVLEDLVDTANYGNQISSIITKCYGRLSPIILG